MYKKVDGKWQSVAVDKPSRAKKLEAKPKNFLVEEMLKKLVMSVGMTQHA